MSTLSNEITVFGGVVGRKKRDPPTIPSRRIQQIARRPNRLVGFGRQTETPSCVSVSLARAYNGEFDLFANREACLVVDSKLTRLCPCYPGTTNIHAVSYVERRLPPAPPKAGAELRVRPRSH